MAYKPGNTTLLDDHSTRHDDGGADPMAANAAAGTPSLRKLGPGATDAAAGTDARLSDSRTPTAHDASHEAGGSDVVTAALVRSGAGIVPAAVGEITVDTTPASLKYHDGAAVQTALKEPGAMTDQVALGLNANRTPNANRGVWVAVAVQVACDDNEQGEVRHAVASAGTPLDADKVFYQNLDAPLAAGAVTACTPVTFYVPPGFVYRIRTNAARGVPVFTLSDIKEWAV